MKLTEEQQARINASLQAKIDRAEALVRDYTEEAIDRIMIKLNFTAETREHSTTLGKLILILEQVDNLQQERDGAAMYASYRRQAPNDVTAEELEKENHEFAKLITRGIW